MITVTVTKCLSRTVRGVVFYPVGEGLWKLDPDDETMTPCTTCDLDALAITLSPLEVIAITSIYYRTNEPITRAQFTRFENLKLVENGRLTQLGRTWCAQLAMEYELPEEWRKSTGGLQKVREHTR